MTDLKAYHGYQAVKGKYVKRMEDHIAADDLIRGEGYLPDGRGCAVGCTLNAYNHMAYPGELGIPEWVAHLNDTLHENTSDSVWPTLQLRFLKEVDPGLSFDEIEHELHIFIQTRNRERVENSNYEGRADILSVIDEVLRLHRTRTAAESAWSAWSAWSAAWSAAESAARSAAESAARSAWSVARSAAWSVASSAAWSVASSAASSAAESAEFDAIAEEFLRLIAVENQKINNA